MVDYAERLRITVAENHLTGASLAYWDGHELHTAVAGVRNSVTRDPVTIDTVMHIGSITKVLNAVMVMQLVDASQIRLTDLICEHLPELRLRDSAALGHITCEMLLNHTNGINCDWLPEYGPDRERIVDTIERCAELDQLFPPGYAASYSNIGTVIAGYLIQKKSGASWYSVIRERIFEPLGMHRALAEPIDTLKFRCSIGDLTDPLNGKAVQTSRPFLAPSFAPAGSTLMTSATDLAMFCRAMLQDGMGCNGARILSARSTLHMMQPTAQFAAPALQVGLGWMITPAGLLTHSGVGPGVYSVLFADLASGRVLALLTNCDRGNVLIQALVNPILESWSSKGRGIGVLSRRFAEDLNPLPYEGVYESNLQRAEVFSERGRLMLRLTLKMALYDTSLYGPLADARPPSVLVALGDHVFETSATVQGAANMELKFVRPDADGRMRFLGLGYRLLARTS